VDRGDEDALAAAIETMLTTIHQYDKAALREYAVERFSNEAVAEAFVGLYRNVGM
jgi:hypothetical protein